MNYDVFDRKETPLVVFMDKLERQCAETKIYDLMLLFV